MKQDSEKYQEGAAPGPKAQSEGVIISPDTRRDERIPPGQTRTPKWPVLDAGQPEPIDLGQWDLRIGGLVEKEVILSWSDFQKLPRVKVFSDFHCVTRWSRLGNLWEGVSTRAILELAGVKPEALFALVVAEMGWATNLPLEDLLAEDALFADTHDGELLSLEHGAPLRLVVPRLYAWKSAKWARGIVLLKNDEPGYWERSGYHMHGDPWQEERFWD